MKFYCIVMLTSATLYCHLEWEFGTNKKKAPKETADALVRANIFHHPRVVPRRESKQRLILIDSVWLCS